MEIPELNIPQLDIFTLPLPEWSESPPVAIPIYPPVTSQIGIPIVNVPGCVEAHRDSNENTNLTQEDDDGLITYCDAGMPSFNPIQYDASRLQMQTEKKWRRLRLRRRPRPRCGCGCAISPPTPKKSARRPQ